MVFDTDWSWYNQMQNVRSKVLGAHIQLKPFFNNWRVSDPIKLRAFKAVIRSQLTYALPIWCWCCVCFMGTLRGEIEIPSFVWNKEILKELNIPSMMETGTKLASNLHSPVVSHPNPSIFALVRFQPKPNNRYLHPCHLLDWSEGHSDFYLSRLPQNKLLDFLCHLLSQWKWKSLRSTDTSAVVISVGRSVPYLHGIRNPTPPWRFGTVWWWFM